jgi:hypothetical protein
MDKCRTCGQALTQQANFCGSCGVQNGQLPEGYDQASFVKLYAEQVNSLLSAYPGQDHTQMMGRLRDKLRISDTSHQVIWKKLSEASIALRPLTTFRLEFNELVPDAFAGHDTYIEFCVHNDSTNEFLSFQLYWDDPETTGEKKFIAQTPHPLQGGISAIVGGSHVFHRPGVKSIDALELTVTNVLNDSAKFRVAPFRVKIGSASQIISNTVTNHTQISIEGRGVIDASGLGSEAIGPNARESQWLELKCSPVLEVVELAWREAVDLAKHLDDLLEQKTLAEKRRLESEEATRRDIEEKARKHNSMEAKSSLNDLGIAAQCIASSHPLEPVTMPPATTALASMPVSPPSPPKESWMRCMKCRQLTSVPVGATRACGYCGVYAPPLKNEPPALSVTPASTRGTSPSSVSSGVNFVKCRKCNQLTSVPVGATRACGYCGLSAPLLMNG